jgi:hypothetical protein
MPPPDVVVVVGVVVVVTGGTGGDVVVVPPDPPLPLDFNLVGATLGWLGFIDSHRPQVSTEDPTWPGFSPTRR